MRKSLLAALSAATLLVICACSGNLFTTFSNEKADASLLFAAQQDITAKDYSDALLLFPQMSTAYQESPEVISLWAQAYSGEGGMDFLTLVNNLTNIGSTPLLLFLMQNFDAGTTAKITDFQNAQNEMMNISTTLGDFSNNDLLQLVTIAMANMGEIISSQADPTGTGNVTGGFSSCSGFTNAQLQAIGTSMNLVANGITQLSNNGVNFGPSLSSYTTACTTLGTIGSGYDFCTVPYGTSFTAMQLNAIEAIIGDGTIIGITACGGTIGGGTCCGL